MWINWFKFLYFLVSYDFDNKCIMIFIVYKFVMNVGWDFKSVFKNIISFWEGDRVFSKYCYGGS